MLRRLPFPLPGVGRMLPFRPLCFTQIACLALWTFAAVVTPAFAAEGQGEAPELGQAEAELLAPADSKDAARRPAFDADARSEDFIASDSERLRGIRGATRPAPGQGEQLFMRALEGFLDYDEEEEILYGPGRTQIFFGDFFLEADRVILDNRVQEVQAEGDVILRIEDPEAGEDGQTEIRADSMRYNFLEGEGVGFNVSGQSPPIYFRAVEDKDEEEGQPDFQQVSQHQSIFHDTAFTTCEFVIPHYNIRAREVILFPNDRIFFRGAKFSVAGVPVLYLPFYTRSLRESSPWFIQLGIGGEGGFRTRVGYEFEHETKEPTFEDETVLERRSFGEARLFGDVLSSRGAGAGAEYRYTFDYDRHKGELQLYGFSDSEREVLEDDPTFDIEDLDDDGGADTEKESERWRALFRHRSQIAEDLYAIVDIDAFSDPEIFTDILDLFNTSGEPDRGRPIVRRGRAAVTFLKEAYVARILVEIKDRVGLDRFADFSDPRDNNFDFDIEPGRDLDNVDADGISQDRFGRVTKRLPQLDVATRWLPTENSPLYFLGELHAFNSLDKGLNTVDDEDDAMVRGIEVYSQALYQYKITERYILLAKVGAGVGRASRQDDDLELELDEVRPIDGIDLKDNDGEFEVGDEDFNLDDIEELYAWVDSEVRLNARLSDALTAFILWRYRETTDDFIGDFYAQIGDVTSREDLFPFRLREHWIEGNATYVLIHPSLVVFANAGQNLISEGERFPNEQVRFYNVGTNWRNNRNTLRLTGSVGGDTRQIGPPDTDGDDEGEQDAVFARASAQYTPIHGRWFARISASRREVSGVEIEDDDDDDFTFFSDEDDETEIDFVYGRELSPKWDAEISGKWDSNVSGLREIALLLERDLHDALLILRIRSERDVSDSDDRDDNEQTLDLSFGLQFKIPEEDIAFGQGEISTIAARQREPIIAY